MSTAWLIDYRRKGDEHACFKYYHEGWKKVNLCIEDATRNNLDMRVYTRKYTYPNGVTIYVDLSPVTPMCTIHVPLVLKKEFEVSLNASFVGIPSYGELKWTTGIKPDLFFTYCNLNLFELIINITNSDESVTQDFIKNLAFFPHIPVIEHTGDLPPMTGSANPVIGITGLPLIYEPTEEEYNYQPASDSLDYSNYKISRGLSASYPESSASSSSLNTIVNTPIHSKRTTKILTEFGYWYGNTDWAGTKSNVLTWTAAPGRLLEGHVEWGQITYPSATNRQLEFPDYHNIFYDGELLATAPGHVSGAAVYWHAPNEDEPTKKTEPWLIVACHVYNYRSDIQAEYHTREFKFFAKKLRTEMNHGTFQYELYLELNKHRQEIGLPPFFLLDTDVNVAQNWADYMNEADDYVHGDFRGRFETAYDSFAWYAENLIQYDDSGNFTAEEVMDLWMASPGHQDNILYNLLQGNEVGGGAGVMFGSSYGSPLGKTYHVTDFIQPIMIPPGFGSQEWMEIDTYLYDGRTSDAATVYYKGIQPCFFNPDGNKAVTQRITAVGDIDFVELTFDFSTLYEDTPVITMSSHEASFGSPRTFGYDYDSTGKVVSADVITRDANLPLKGDNLYLDVNGTQVPTSFVDWWHKDSSGTILYDDINLDIATIYPLLYLDPRHSLASYVEIYGTSRNTGSGSVKYKVAFKGNEIELASFPLSHIMDVEKFTASLGGGSEIVYNYQHWSFSQSFSWLHKGWYAVGTDGTLACSQMCTDNVWTFWQNDDYYFPGISNDGSPIGLHPTTCIDNLLTWNRKDLRMAEPSYDRANDKYPFSSGSPGNVETVSLYANTEDMFTYWNLGYNSENYKLIKNIVVFNEDNPLERVRMRERVQITTVIRGTPQEIT